MGMLSNLLLLPVKGPVSGTLWVAGKISEAAEAQRNDRSVLMAALKQAEEDLLAGRLSDDDYDVLETDLLERLRDAR